MSNKINTTIDGLEFVNDAGRRVVIRTNHGAESDQYIDLPSSGGVLSTGGGADGNDLVKVSSNDTTAGYLENKLVAGSNITLTTNNDGGNETLTIASAGGVDTDEKSKVSANDTTSGYLNGKLVAGSGISFTENNNGGDESLTIASTVTDQLVKARSSDTTANYLASKLAEGTGISFNILNSGGNELISIASTVTNTDQVAKVSSNDTTAGFLNGKLVAGTGITLTENNNGSNETLTIASSVTNTDQLAKVSSNDTTAGYLNGKLVAGSGITLTEGSDGGNETLTIAASGGGGGGGGDDTDLPVTLTDYASPGNVGTFFEVTGGIPALEEGDMIIIDYAFEYKNSSHNQYDCIITRVANTQVTTTRFPVPTSSTPSYHFVRQILIAAREAVGSGNYLVYVSELGSNTYNDAVSTAVYQPVSHIGLNTTTIKPNIKQVVNDWTVSQNYRLQAYFDTSGAASYVYPIYGKAILRKGGATL
jgi:hypothetical protein